MSERKQRIIITKQLLRIIENNINANVPLIHIFDRLSVSYSIIKKHAQKISDDQIYIKISYKKKKIAFIFEKPLSHE